MNAQEFYNKLFTLLPDAQIDTDNYGQVIIYTNLKEVGRLENGQPKELIKMEDEDFEIAGI